jgi:predicted Zn-dependent protease
LNPKPQTKLWRSVRACLLATALATLVSCSTKNIVQAPTGRFQVQAGAFNQYSPEQDIEIGRQAAAEVYRQMPVLSGSSPITKYIQRLGKRLASHAPGPIHWPFSFHVVNVKEINAFALPGGPIYVNVGTIRAADDEGQLAGVLAHEISHVVLRHSTQQASKQAFAQLPLAVLGATVGRGVAGSAAQLGAAFGVQSLFLKYSRNAEKEADLLGSQIMYDAGYNPYSMVEFFSKLEKEGGPGVPQFLSDHPNPGNRVENVRDAMREYPKKRYRPNSAEFERIKSQVVQLHPLTSQEVAEHARQEKIGNITLSDVTPSGQFKTLDHNAFRISYPDNWEIFGDTTSAATIAPAAAASESAIAYGVIINATRRPAGESIDQATSEVVDSLRQSNPGLRLDGTIQTTQVDGAAAREVYFVGQSPLPGTNGRLPERDWLVTVERGNGSILYLVFIAPERDFERLAPTYRQMVASLRLKQADALTNPSRN